MNFDTKLSSQKLHRTTTIFLSNHIKWNTRLNWQFSKFKSVFDWFTFIWYWNMHVFKCCTDFYSILEKKSQKLKKLTSPCRSSLHTIHNYFNFKLIGKHYVVWWMTRCIWQEYKCNSCVCLSVYQSRACHACSCMTVQKNVKINEKSIFLSFSHKFKKKFF